MATILSINIGFGNTKAVWGRHQASEDQTSWSEICFRSVCPRVLVDESGSGRTLGTRDRIEVSVGDNRFYVGPKSTLEGGVRALRPDYINTPEHEALLIGAWHYMFKDLDAIFPTIDLLVLGLPVSGFQANRKRLMELGSKVRRIPVPMSMRARCGKDSIDVVAKKVLVLPQPMGGLRLASDSSSEYELLDDGVILMMIDPGYSTFDWFVADGMVPQLDQSGSFQGGVSQILQVVSSKLGFDHGVGSQNFGLVEKALVAGVLNMDHLKIDMVPYRKVADSTASAIVDEFLQRLNPSKAGVSHIYVCGGGAVFYFNALKERLSNFKVKVLPDGVMSNCREFFLSGQDTLEED